MHVRRAERVFHDGDRFFADLRRAIGEARESVDLETYIFARDRLGNQVLEQLRAAARRGVRVRLLLDGFGCSTWTHADLAPLLAAGMQVRFFHPLPWQLSGGIQLGRMLALRRLLLGLWKLNRRNHRKTCVIDGRIAFLGGMNVSRRHLAQAAGAGGFRDTSVRIEGDAVRGLVRAFERAWRHPRRLRHRRKRPDYERLVRRILGARRRVWITNPYFVPELSLIRALRFAAWAGADVRLLLPRQSDVWGMKWAVGAFYRVLLGAGVRIFEYTPSLLHAKIVLVDGWARVGSSNLNHRSLFHDLEVDVVLGKAKSVRSIEAQFLEDLRGAREVELPRWQTRGLAQKLMERVALGFRRWL